MRIFIRFLSGSKWEKAILALPTAEGLMLAGAIAVSISFYDFYDLFDLLRNLHTMHLNHFSFTNRDKHRLRDGMNSHKSVRQCGRHASCRVEEFVLILGPTSL
jgi:hypothetical protein